MPKAFTHLCKKVNLSLYDDTLTVYPKPKLQSPNKLPPVDELSELFALLFTEMDCVRVEVKTFFMQRSKELGVSRFVRREDSDDDLYHQDNFKMDDVHYHAQFAITINEPKLDSILDILEKYSIISENEHKSFIKAYHDANNLPEKDSPTKKTSVNASAAIKTKEETSTFGGLKRGFFLPKDTSKVKHNIEQKYELKF